MDSVETKSYIDYTRIFTFNDQIENDLITEVQIEVYLSVPIPNNFVLEASRN